MEYQAAPVCLVCLAYQVLAVGLDQVAIVDHLERADIVVCLEAVDKVEHLLLAGTQDIAGRVVLQDLVDKDFRDRPARVDTAVHQERLGPVEYLATAHILVRQDLVDPQGCLGTVGNLERQDLVD